MSKRSLQARSESWPIRGSFRISRGAKTTAEVIVVEITQDGVTGRGECVPYARYGESIRSVLGQITAVRDYIADGLTRDGLLTIMPSGAARNAVDCALWDLEAKQTGKSIAAIARIPAPGPVITAYTLSLDSPEKMGDAAKAARHRPLFKLKLGGEGDLERVAAVRANAPQTRLIVDANEAWTPDMMRDYCPKMADFGVELIEQPLPAGEDAILGEMERPVPICADESAHDTATLDAVTELYDFINIKLDKTGGLTEALLLAEAARGFGLGVMVGCMLGTSLGMAPAMYLSPFARFVDLDGPLLLEKDRENGITFDGSIMHPPKAELWG
ncbi:MAG: L-Ala-D/L-Glu epimerase [Sneathiella sp.]|jgi:L-alanine-DL-glutamate epimerase-like enolase superfamily enzyme|uniref:N-acetyl-D-Glu racemase DgcA n=1 Tax=Sneathiella sp. TaxID=1964365 RepID=UPI000C366C13|nr:N-acetyl-D-Glu racemase DgcA [Sneathiella sp.]MAL77567.1 L-Ala-D/L-Glu epimerase [Sneathiella sp.]